MGWDAYQRIGGLEVEFFAEELYDRLEAVERCDAEVICLVGQAHVVS
jgi:hypothetical protein